jgi:hypothetical protein
VTTNFEKVVKIASFGHGSLQLEWMVVVVMGDDEERMEVVSLDGEPRIACPGFLRAEFQSQLRLALALPHKAYDNCEIFESVNNGVSDLQLVMPQTVV